jgi:hypothetical protein
LERTRRKRSGSTNGDRGAPLNMTIKKFSSKIFVFLSAFICVHRRLK